MRPAASGHATGAGDFLDGLVKRTRHLQIHILNWDFPMIYAMIGRPRRFLGWAGSRITAFTCALTAIFRRRLAAPKLVVIDDAVAFVGGIDLGAGRWDTPEHIADDPRRATGACPTTGARRDDRAGRGSRRAIGELARERWRRAAREDLATAEPGNDPWPRTGPDLKMPKSPSRGLLLPMAGGPRCARWRRSTSTCRRRQAPLYLENQYFTSARIGEAIGLFSCGAFPIRLFLSPLSPDGWLEGPIMGSLRAQLLKRLRELDRYGRLHVYYPVVPGWGTNA